MMRKRGFFALFATAVVAGLAVFFLRSGAKDNDQAAASEPGDLAAFSKPSLESEEPGSGNSGFDYIDGHPVGI